MKLDNIETLFNPIKDPQYDTEYMNSDPENPHWTPVHRYPLGFLQTVGNVQAGGIPYCFHKTVAAVNKAEQKDLNECMDDTDDTDDDESRESQLTYHIPT